MYRNIEESGPPPRRPITKSTRIMLGALGVALAFITLLVVLSQCRPSTSSTDIVWIAEKTTHSPGAIPRALRSRVRAAGAEAGVRFSTYAVGEQAIPVADAEALDLDRGNGKVGDAGQQAANVDRILKDVNGRIEKAAVSRTGFSLYAALRAAANEVERAGHVEAWLSTTVLTGSTDPLTIAALSAGAEPAQAVDELMKTPLKELDLHDVDLHVVLLTPVGDEQRPLDLRAESWRTKFITELADRLGAHVDGLFHDSGTAPPWRDSSRVPVIAAAAPPPQAVTPGPPRIDNAAFEPDSAELIDRSAATAAATEVARQYRAKNGRSRITVTGYCAKYGNADGARVKSAERAEAIAALLREQGVPDGDIDTAGSGFDRLAPGSNDLRSPAQRVVVIELTERP
ncbi:OmpA family protein [Amycolatopsis solani]|uniref:OmpA family protein n=1 Tax=Amycolatopsis solani TaxID=3028615 RepID=UPI0025AFEADA|nr:OmpA family protein [Amycolatopsis sp. MEP2-6]